MKLENGPSPHIPKQPYVTEILSAPYDKKPTVSPEDIAWETAISRPVLQSIVTFIRKGYRGSVTVADILPDPDSMEQSVEQHDMFEYVNRCIGLLNIPYAQEVLHLRHMEDLPYEQIGKTLGFSGEQARQINIETLPKLQEIIYRLDTVAADSGGMIR